MTNMKRRERTHSSSLALLAVIMTSIVAVESQVASSPQRQVGSPFLWTLSKFISRVQKVSTFQKNNYSSLPTTSITSTMLPNSVDANIQEKISINPHKHPWHLTTTSYYKILSLSCHPFMKLVEMSSLSVPKRRWTHLGWNGSQHRNVPTNKNLKLCFEDIYKHHQNKNTSSQHTFPSLPQTTFVNHKEITPPSPLNRYSNKPAPHILFNSTRHKTDDPWNPVPLSARSGSHSLEFASQDKARDSHKLHQVLTGPISWKLPLVPPQTTIHLPCPFSLSTLRIAHDSRLSHWSIFRNVGHGWKSINKMGAFGDSRSIHKSIVEPLHCNFNPWNKSRKYPLLCREMRLWRLWDCVLSRRVFHRDTNWKTRGERIVSFVK